MTEKPNTPFETILNSLPAWIGRNLFPKDALTDEKAHYAGCYATLLLSGSAETTMAIWYYSNARFVMACLEIVIVASVALVCFLGVALHKPRQAFQLQLLIAWFGLNVSMIGQGGFASPHSVPATMLGPLIFVFGSQWLGLLISGLSVVSLVVTLILSRAGLLPPIIEVSDAIRFTGHILNIGSLLAAAFVLTYLRTKSEAILEGERAKTAEQAKKKSRFLIHLNHELRNPLSTIVTSVEILDRETSRTPQVVSSARVKSLVTSISNTSRHVLEMLNNVLEMERLESRQDPASNEEFDVRRLMRETLDMLSVTANEAGNTLTVRFESGLPDRWCGPTSNVRQVVLNLVSNAIKHAPRSDIVVSVSQSDGGLEFEISDTGPGLSEQAKRNLYEPFASSLGGRGTTGLGLYICKLIVEKQLRGTLEHVGGPEHGCVFKVRIPLTRSNTPQKTWEYADKASQAPAPGVAEQEQRLLTEGLAGATLLLVDDDQDNREIIQMALSDLGMVVTTAMTSQEAIAILQDSHFDVTLLDYNLGAASEDDGMQLARRIAGRPAGAIVGYTGNMSENLSQQWEAVGVKAIIRKPATVHTLATTILGSVQRTRGR